MGRKKRMRAEKARLRKLGLFPEKGAARPLYLVPTGQTFLAKTAKGATELLPVLQAFSPARRALRALRRGEDPAETARPGARAPGIMERLFGRKSGTATTPAIGEPAVPNETKAEGEADGNEDAAE